MGIKFIQDNFSKESQLGKMAEQASLGFCPFCGNPVSDEDFRDEISRKEFEISGLCQKCQDKTFGGSNE